MSADIDKRRYDLTCKPRSCATRSAWPASSQDIGMALTLAWKAAMSVRHWTWWISTSLRVV